MLLNFVLFLFISSTALCIRPQISSRLADEFTDKNSFESTICISASCKKNKTEASSKTDTIIKNEVVVNINTNIDLSKKEVPTAAANGSDGDVPVFLGFAGTEKDNNNFKTDNAHIFDNLPPTQTYQPIPISPPEGLKRGEIDESIPTFYVEPDFFKPSQNFPNFDNEGQRRVAPNGILYNSGNEINFHKVPHFEPSYNKHYFGERPPPHFVFSSKPATVSTNPVAFTNTPKVLWKPSLFWPEQRHYPQNTHTHHTQQPCNYQPQTRVGLQWHPKAKGSTVKIDDKLAPLN